MKIMLEKSPTFAIHAVCLATTAFVAGCVELRDIPTTMPFEDPPIRQVIEPLPKTALVGKWSSAGKSALFVDGKRMMSFLVQRELEILDDGSCTVSEKRTVEESYGDYRTFSSGGFESFTYEGTWMYADDVLTLNLDLKAKKVYGVTKARQSLVQNHTLKWHSPDEFSTSDTDEQFWGNLMESKMYLRWSKRTVSPNGVEKLRSKETSYSPEQFLYICNDPFRRQGNPWIAPKSDHANRPMTLISE